MRPLDGKTFVAGQIFPADMAAIAAAGVTLIVNNRPDHEEPGQPDSAEIEAAARAAGLDYRYIPIGYTIGSDAAAAMAEALGATEGKVLAFCRAGIRSTRLWMAAQQ
jgi:uncharacterized protein (TIGR01244 family)